MPGSESLSALALVDKPQGITSHTVVSKLRRALGIKKIGHAGTLDPMATGLVLAGVGPATRLLTYLVGLDKEYYATIRLGAASSTEDADGELTIDPQAISALKSGSSLKEQLGLGAEQLEAAMSKLRGKISQVPSAVSAIKVNGQRAYNLVRSGIVPELKAREVEIFEFELLGASSVQTDEASYYDLEVRVACSSGSYIRALARDLGVSLGVSAHLIKLRRSRVGPFLIAEAIELEKVAESENPQAELISANEVAARIFRTVELSESEFELLKNGRKLEGFDQSRVLGESYKRAKTDSQLVAASFKQKLVSLLQLENSAAKPVLVLINNN